MGVAELYQRLRLLMTFARVLRVDDSGALQLMQVEGLRGEIRDDVPRIGQWGFYSNPPLNSQAVVLALGADRGQCVVIGVEDRETRPNGAESGESGIYSSSGALIRVRADGSILISGTGRVEILGDEIEVTADGNASISVAGNVDVQAGGNVAVDAVGNASVLAASATVAVTGAASITAGGVATINGGSVVIGSNSTIDGKPFLAHTHNSTTPGNPTGPVN